MHSWYQMMLGTNESMYAWMDEGFTTYATDMVLDYYRDNVTRKQVANDPVALQKLDSAAAELPLHHADNYRSYYFLAASRYEEPLTTHADHFNTNFGYSLASYVKGCVFMEQLGYIIGAGTRDKVLLEYYRQWRFKHPNAADFVKIAEDLSGIKLDWYKEYWCSTTKTINYSIDSLWEEGNISKIRLKRIGQVPMPVDLELTFKNGEKEMHYVPLNLMFGEKPAENGQKREVHAEWRWTHPTYIVECKHKLTDLKKVEIDPSKRMADVDQSNNLLELHW